MPLVRIALLRGKSRAYRKALQDGVYRAMREAFGVPEDDRFILTEEYKPSNFSYSHSYLGIIRDDDLVIVQITANNTRTLEQKKALYARVAELLAENPGVRPENILINLVEVAKENWSFGNGLAQYG